MATHRFVDEDPGVLLGIAIGDALGAPFETSDPDCYRLIAWDGRMTATLRGEQVWPAGTTTDDTGMARALAQALVNSAERGCRGYDPEEAAQQYLAWYRRDSRGIGKTTRRAMEKLAAGASHIESGVPCETDRTGNGPAMRAAPIGLRFAFRPREERIAAAIADSQITHLGEDAEAGAIAVVEAIAAQATIPFGEWRPLSALEAADRALTKMDIESSVHGKIGMASVRVRFGGPLSIGASGEIGDTVATALYFAARASLEGRGFTEAVRDAVRYGGDTDTRAAIVGAIMMARLGTGDALLRDWNALEAAGSEPGVLRDLDGQLRRLALGEIAGG